MKSLHGRLAAGLRGMLVAATAMLAAGCAHGPVSWTPETVRPPESFEEALAAVGAVPGAAGEDAHPLQDEQPVPGEALPITRDGAILTALANNQSLAVSRFGPAVADTFVPEARAMFDPRLLATASRGRDTRQFAGAARFTFGQAAAAGQPVVPELSPIEQLVFPAPFVDALGQARQAEQTLRVLAADAERILRGNPEPYLETRVDRGEARLSQYLPTGTQVFLSGDVTRSRTNFTPDEHLGAWSIGVNQALLRGAGTNANLAALRQARNAAAASRYEFKDMVSELVLHVESAYWELVLAENLRGIREFSVKLAEEQRQLNADLVEVGKAARGAVISAEAEAASRRADLADAEALVKQRTLDLVRLLNPDATGGWGMRFAPADPPEVAEVPVDPEASSQLALLYRPELAQSRLAVATQELEVIRTANGLLPRLDAFAEYGRTSLGDSWSGASRHLDASRYDHYTVGVTLEVPIGNRAEKARLQRARYGRDRAEAAVRNLEQFIEAGVRSAAVEVRRQWERIGASQAAFDSRSEELRVMQDRYSVGMATNLDLLQVQRFLIEAQVAEVTARVRYIQALTALYRAEGALLERRGIHIEDYFGEGDSL